MLSLAGVFVAIASSGAGLFSVVSSGAGALRPEDALSAGAGAGAPPGAGLAGPDVLAEGGGGDARGADAADAPADAPASRDGDLRSRTAAEENFAATRAMWEFEYAKMTCEGHGYNPIIRAEICEEGTWTSFDHCVHHCVDHLLYGPIDVFFDYYFAGFATYVRLKHLRNPSESRFGLVGFNTRNYSDETVLKSSDARNAEYFYVRGWDKWEFGKLQQMCKSELCSIHDNIDYCVYLCVRHFDSYTVFPWSFDPSSELFKKFDYDVARASARAAFTNSRK